MQTQNCPHWLMIMSYFGLDHSFPWTQDHVKHYSDQYHEEMEIDEMITNKMAISNVEVLIKQIEKLNLSADSAGCSGEVTVVNLDLLSELADLAECIKHLRQKAAEKPSVPDIDCCIQYSIDGGHSYHNANNGVRIVYAQMDVPGEDGKGELHINATDEGIIMDVWSSREEHLDHNIGSSSEMANEIVDRLVGDDPANNDEFICTYCNAKHDIEDSVSTTVGLMCCNCMDGSAATSAIIDWNHECTNGDTKLGFKEWLSHCKDSCTAIAA